MTGCNAVLQAWEHTGFDNDWAKSLGLDVRGLRFARDVRRQLEGITGFDGSALTAGGGSEEGAEESVGLQRAPAEHLERADIGVRRGRLDVPTCWQSVTGVVSTFLMWAALSRACSASVRVWGRTDANAAAAGDGHRKSWCRAAACDLSRQAWGLH